MHTSKESKAFDIPDVKSPEVGMVLESTQPIREFFLLLKFDESDEQTTQQLPAESSSNIFVYAI